jgi:hypothetical protein
VDFLVTQESDLRGTFGLSHSGLEKTRVFKKKTRPSVFFWFFWVFWGFLGFLGFFGFFCPDERVFGFFQFHEYL